MKQKRIRTPYDEIRAQFPNLSEQEVEDVYDQMFIYKETPSEALSALLKSGVILCDETIKPI
jgi:hypothetical protein